MEADAVIRISHYWELSLDCEYVHTLYIHLPRLLIAIVLQVLQPDTPAFERLEARLDAEWEAKHPPEPIVEPATKSVNTAQTFTWTWKLPEGWKLVNSDGS